MAILGCVACSRGDRTSAVEISRAVTIAPWAAGVSYPVGALATFNGVTFRCRQAHTSQVGWEPPKVPALWERPGVAGINPWTNQTAYVLGSGVTFDGLVYRCIQPHTSQPDWTPPATPALWKVTGNVQIPPGLSGSLVFVFTRKNLPAAVVDGFGLVQRDAFGDPSYTELLDSKQKFAGEVFHRMAVQGGEILELYLQANKTRAASTPSMSPATYSSDPTANASVDPTTPDHVAQPLQTPAQKAAHVWSLRWESFKFGDPGRDGKFDDIAIELRLEVPCNNSQIICTDPNLVVSRHDASRVDYRGDVSHPLGPSVPGVPVGPLKDPAGGEGNPTPIGSTVLLGGRIDTLRWSFVQESTDFSAVTPPETTVCGQCTVPGAAMLGGGLWSLQLQRIHRPRAEAFVSSFGPGVFGNFDAKLRLVPNGIGNQNTVELFDPRSDAPPVTFFELSQQDGDTTVDGRYHDNATRMYAGLVLLNDSGAPEPNPFAAKTAVVTRQSGDQIKFEIIDVQGTGASELQGRLTAMTDRNGNAATATYQFPAASTDADLGGDRKKLWLLQRVADPHGVSATISYQLRTGTSRWVVRAITFPDGTTAQYQYGADGTNLDRLIKVVHPNGDSSTFSRAWDPSSQSWALTFKDAVDGEVSTWKTVFVTGSTFTSADNVIHSQEPNLVRRVVNNDGEQAYSAIEDPNDPNSIFFREGTDRLTHLRIDATGLPRETARATTASPDPLLATYAVVESYVGDVAGMIQQAKDGFGNVRIFARDSKTRAITSVTVRDGTTATFMLNPFLQPTRTVDRLGRIRTAKYDSKGNPLSITHAVGTAAQALWGYLNNARGQITRVTDANGKTTDYVYTAAGFLASIIDPPDLAGGARPVRTFEYDSVGRLSAAVDASGRRVTFTYDSRGRLQTTSYPDGTTETIIYGAGPTAGVVIARTDRNGIVEQDEYDPSRRLIRRTHAAGRAEQIVTAFEYAAGTQKPTAQTIAGDRVEIGYDERLRPISRTVFLAGSRSLTVELAWDILDREIRDTDPYGRRAFRVYDEDGRAIRTVTELVPGGVPAGSDPSTLSRITTGNPPYIIEDTGYDPMNQVISTTDGRGFVTAQAYDAQGRRTTLIEAAGRPEQRKTAFEYDPVGNVTRKVEPRTFTEGASFQILSTYTGRNLLATRTEAAGSADAATVALTYTPTGKPATMTDARGGVTTYGYDTCCDRLTSVRNPAGFTTSYGYDGVGNRTSVVNPLGAATTAAYDGNNRLASQTDPLDQTTRYLYDDDLSDGIGLDLVYGDFLAGSGFGPGADGSGVQTTNPAGESIAQFRDGAGRVVLTVNASGNGTRTAHDAVVSGLVETAVSNPLGNVTREQSDGAGHVRVTVDAAGKSITRSFDPAGHVVSERDANGVGQDCVFDALGQRTSCIDTRSDTTRSAFDAAGNEVDTTDGAGVHTICTFDFRNRMKSCTDGIGATTRWAYDGNSNLISMTDAEGGVTTYAYEARNLRSVETFPDSSGASDRVTKIYDAAGRLATTTDQDGNAVGNTYDLADRLTIRAYPDGKSDTFTYDATGRLVSGASQRYDTLVTRSYDSGGRLAAESLLPPSSETTLTVGYSYDVADRVTSVQYPDGTVVARTYTDRDLLESISIGPRAIARYDYDDDGRLKTAALGNGLTETRSYRGDSSISSIVTPTVGDLAYSYDPTKRKLSESGSAVNSPQSFAYDRAGRLTNWTNGASTQSWVLSLVGDWQSTTRNSFVESRTHDAAHELTAISGIQLGYDGRGNLVSDDVGNRLTWDFDNRIRSHVLSESGTGASYLYDVLGRKVGRVAGPLTTIFVHSQDQVVAEYDNGDLRVNYILGATVDRPVAYLAQGTVYWYSSNHLGTVVAVTDGTGAAVERYRYDAYGERTVLSPTRSVRSASLVGNQIGFTGRYHDPLTGLVDFRSRQYDARMGRFISRDSGYIDGASLYRAYFVPNAVDPTGHFSGFGLGGSIFEPGGLSTYPPGWCFLTDNLSDQGDEFSIGNGTFGGGLTTAVRFGLTLRGGGLLACLPGGPLDIGGGGGGPVGPPPPPPVRRPPTANDMRNSPKVQQERKVLWQIAENDGQKHEFGAYIFADKDTGELTLVLGMSTACTATMCEFRICPAPPQRPGLVLVGFMHTHPWDSQPSDLDRDTANTQNIPVFVIHGDSFTSAGPPARASFNGPPGCQR